MVHDWTRGEAEETQNTYQNRERRITTERLCKEERRRQQPKRITRKSTYKGIKGNNILQ